jgi:hypothetical protein
VAAEQEPGGTVIWEACRAGAPGRLVIVAVSHQDGACASRVGI